MTVAEALLVLADLPPEAPLLAGGFQVRSIVVRRLKGREYADIRIDEAKEPEGDS